MTGERQVGQVRAVLSDYPAALQVAEEFRRGRGHGGLPDWPDWCFLPLAGAAAIVQPAGPLTPAHLPDLARLGALLPWHYTRGVYHFHPHLAGALSHSPLEDHLPAEVFHRLPQWCLYLELPAHYPGLFGEVLHGFYVHLEWDANGGDPELRLLFDEDTGLHPLMLHLGDWTVLEAVDRTSREATRQAARFHIAAPDRIGPTTIAVADRLVPLVSLVLYLCSDTPQITDPRRPGRRPERPHPTKTKKGWRLFPPDQVTEWQVGETLATDLGPHATGFWTGDWRDGRYTYRWLSLAGALE